MRAAHNNGRASGGWGNGMLPPLSILHRVERLHIERGHVVWLKEGCDHGIRELANQAADKLRKEGWTIRVRPVVL